MKAESTDVSTANRTSGSRWRDWTLLGLFLLLVVWLFASRPAQCPFSPGLEAPTAVDSTHR